MTERIKLTELDLQVIYFDEEHAEIRITDQHGFTKILTKKDADQLKQQILDDQEKAEKWDEYFIPKATHESFQKLEQENKQLKEYKKEIERLATDDLLWKKVIEMDKLEHIKKEIEQ